MRLSGGSLFSSCFWPFAPQLWETLFGDTGINVAWVNIIRGGGDTQILCSCTLLTLLFSEVVRELKQNFGRWWDLQMPFVHFMTAGWMMGTLKPYLLWSRESELFALTGGRDPKISHSCPLAPLHQLALSCLPMPLCSEVTRTLKYSCMLIPIHPSRGGR